MNISIDIDSVEKLDRYIRFVKNFQQIKTDENFQTFIQKKALDTLESVMNQRLVGGTTNDEEIELYKKSNHVKKLDDGFEIYNNAHISADKYNILSFDTSAYQNGQFSIALAFEYGTGVNSKATLKLSQHSKHYDYETNEWYLPKNVTGSSGVKTKGYPGFEIYRYTAIKINENIKKWYEEYMKTIEKRG